MLKNLSLQKVLKIILFFLFFLGVLVLTACSKIETGVLNPKGLIAYKERQLLFDSIALMLIVVIPVIIMSFAFVARYRAANKEATYRPEWSHSVMLEVIWWGVPLAIIIVLASMTWIMTHRLDPYKKINTVQKPLLIQAVAMPWKWLFIYPEQKIATVNYLEIPKGRQISFWLTSDNVPMSAFFIPQLGSQIYTMAGMRTRLHLIAEETATIEGLNANFNGDGFSDMRFTVNVVEPVEMQKWIKKVKTSRQALNAKQYKRLLVPKEKAPVEYFSAVPQKLFEKIIQTYKKVGVSHPRHHSPFSYKALEEKKEP